VETHGAVMQWVLKIAGLASKLIQETCEKQNIQPDQLGIHADRGSAMRSKPVAFLLADLSVTKTHSRPYTSNVQAHGPWESHETRSLTWLPRLRAPVCSPHTRRGI
jgi:putative transposase